MLPTGVAPSPVIYYNLHYRSTTNLHSQALAIIITSTSSSLEKLNESLCSGSPRALVGEATNHLDDATEVKSSSVSSVLSGSGSPSLGGVDDSHEPVEESRVEAPVLSVLEERAATTGLDHGDHILHTQLLLSRESPQQRSNQFAVAAQL